MSAQAPHVLRYARPTFTKGPPFDPDVEAPTRLALREAIAGDAGTLTAIDALCFPPEDRYARGLMEDILQGKFLVDTVDRVSTVVAFERTAAAAERALGFITVARDRGFGLIVTVDVHPEHRRRGVGRMLLKAGETKMREWGVTGAVLTVGTKNVPAQRLYEREGYILYRRIPGYYESGDDALEMHKKLF
jgi:ribosomal-protein-alanine N-acetyltransferase